MTAPVTCTSPGGLTQTPCPDETQQHQGGVVPGGLTDPMPRVLSGCRSCRCSYLPPDSKKMGGVCTDGVGMLSNLPRTQPWVRNMRFLLHSITRILNLNWCPASLGCLQGVVADLGDPEMDALDMDSPLPAPGPFRMAASLLPSKAQPLTCWVVSVCREDAEPAAALPGHCPLQGPLLGARPAGQCCPIAAWRASQSPGGIGGSADEGPSAVTPTCSPKVFCL